MQGNSRESDVGAITRDAETTVQSLRELVAEFVAERDWQQFHSPKNLAMSISIEAAELMEHFQWDTVNASREVKDDPEKRAAVAEELADVLSYCLALANTLNIEVSDAMKKKMAKNRLKYPVDRYRGRAR